MQKILLDSNILIYAFDKSAEFHSQSIKVFGQIAELYTTQSNLYEFYRIMTSKPFQKKVSPGDVIGGLQFYKKCLQIIYPTTITDIVLADLINQYQPKSAQIWDFLVLAQSMENSIDIIYTKNTKHFPQNQLLKIVDPTI
ncbi:MAG: PIN domain-containing protein [bacterium]